MMGNTTTAAGPLAALEVELPGQVWCSEHAASTARDMEDRAAAMQRRASVMAADGRALLDDGWAAGQGTLDAAYALARDAAALAAAGTDARA